MEIDPLEVARVNAQIESMVTMLETYYGAVKTQARHLDKIIQYIDEWSKTEPNPTTVENLEYILTHLRKLGTNLHTLGTYRPGGVSKDDFDGT